MSLHQNTPKYNTIIFDMDGCLVDSYSVQRMSLFSALKAAKKPYNEEIFQKFLTFTGDSLENIFTKMEIPLSTCSIFRKTSVDNVNKVIPNQELIEIIKTLRKKGFKFGICSGKEHDRIMQIIQFHKIDYLFDCVVGSNEVKKPKPYPDSLIFCLKELAKDDFKPVPLFVGDGQNDIECAKNAKVDSALSTWFSKQIFKGSTYIVNNPQELLDIVL